MSDEEILETLSGLLTLLRSNGVHITEHGSDHAGEHFYWQFGETVLWSDGKLEEA